MDGFIAIPHEQDGLSAPSFLFASIRHVYQRGLDEFELVEMDAPGSSFAFAPFGTWTRTLDETDSFIAIPHS
jgi:hypothetical protein